MSARTLLAHLRGRGVRLEARGDLLGVDAPTGVITEGVRTALAENKRDLIRLLSRERCRLEEADRRGLLVRWSEHPTWVRLHDPTTGEWHEVKADQCLPGVVETANNNHEKGVFA
jgi:hypothetical protein